MHAPALLLLDEPFTGLDAAPRSGSPRGFASCARAATPRCS